MTKPTPPGRARAYHHGHLRDALIDIALQRLNQAGAWNFTLRELARRAGVSHAAAYNHFANKSALLAAVAARGFELLRERTARAGRRASRSARRRLAAIATAYIEFGLDHPAHYRLMFGPELASVKNRFPELREASEAAFQVLRGVLQEGQAAGEFRRGSIGQQAMASWSLVHGLTMLLIDRRLFLPNHQPPVPGRSAEVAARILLEGLAASAPRA